MGNVNHSFEVTIHLSIPAGSLEGLWKRSRLATEDE
jgi:hypothetical protein